MEGSITREELKAKMDRGDSSSWRRCTNRRTSGNTGHRGASSRRMDKTSELVPDKDAFVVTYCSNFS